MEVPRARTFRSNAPLLSPGTAQALIAAFSNPGKSPTTPSPSYGAEDYASSSSDSPDSLYSASSPVLADHPAFEFDEQDDDRATAVQTHDQDEYDALLQRELEEDEDGEGPNAWGSPSWGRWPESRSIGGGGVGMADWSPSPKDSGTPRKGSSIISLSPRGSLSHSLGGHGSRRGSAPISLRAKASLDQGALRRDSNPSLLGFDLAQQRRRSSTRSLTGSGGGGRRRSSAFSSSFDPAEESLLRNIASMELLRRRFSEVVEVTSPSSDEEDDDGEENDDVMVARARMSSIWSPSTCSSSGMTSATDMDTDSEIHTAPYFPTPPPPRSNTVPGLLSNFPLASVAQDPQQPPSTPSDISVGPSPALRPRMLPNNPSTAALLFTPPPVVQPRQLLRSRTASSRPTFPRAETDYQFPPRSVGVPLGAGPPRPILQRAVSNPFFSELQRSSDAVKQLEKRAAGSFPIARSAPLGISPLRESLRRQSVVSADGDTSRRPSTTTPFSGRRPSDVLDTGTDGRRRSSAVSADSRRPSVPIVAERRMSIVAGRRFSGDTRRGSAKSGGAGSSSRKSSVVTFATTSRKGSTDSRRGSRSSRKSSVVSFGEYGYLAPEIIIDAPATPLPSASSSSSALLPDQPPHLGQRRQAAPASIVLPDFVFPVTAPNTPYTPRTFNPLASFLGTPTASVPDPLTPGPRYGSVSPLWSDHETTPQLGAPPTSPRSIMDRGRPIGPPEFEAVLPRRVVSPTQPATSILAPTRSTSLHFRPTSAHTSPEPQHQQHRVVSRKAVPSLSREDLAGMAREQAESSIRDTAQELDWEMQKLSEGERAILRAAARVQTPQSQQHLHRRTGSADHPAANADLQRPHARRQATMPDASSSPQHRRPHSISRPAVHPTNSTPTPTPSPRRQQLQKRSSVTFSETPQSIPQQPHPAASRPGMGRTSSFTRFFHKSSSSSKPAPTATSTSASAGGRPLRPAIRPTSMMDGSSGSGSGSGGSSLGSDRTMVDVREVFRKIGGSPRSS